MAENLMRTCWHIWSIIALLLGLSSGLAQAGSVFRVKSVLPPARADMLIVAVPPLLDSSSVQRLARWRADRDDFDVALLDASPLLVEDDLDAEAHALQQALRTISLEWGANHTPSGKPGYVLLIGDHPEIPGVRLPHPKRDSDEIFVTDAPYAYLGTSMPFMALGRLPTSGVSELDAMVSKIIRYESNSQPADWHRQALYVTEFASERELPVIEDLLEPAGVQMDVIAADREYYDTSISSLIEALPQGYLFAYYYGHGVVTGWRLLPNSRVNDLAPTDRLPILLAETCSSAQYANPGHASLAERLLARPDGGAVAYVGSTIEIYPNRGFLEQISMAIYGKGYYRIGDVLRYVQQTVGTDFMQAIVLLGDPAMSLAGVSSHRSLPDLSIRLDTMNQEILTMPRHEEVELRFTVRNLGQQDAPAVQVQIWDRRPGNSQRPLLLETRTLGPIPAQGESVLRFAHSWQAYSALGRHLVQLQIDPGDQLQEACEWNNQGAQSVEISNHIDGWPLTEYAPLSSPMAADVDGDGIDELVYAGGQLHVRRVDGTELPGWPARLLGSNGASPAIGDLDGDGTPELVAAYATVERNFKVSVFDARGQPYLPEIELANLPPLELNWNQMSARIPERDIPYPALGDLDGDGDLEIIVLVPTEKGGQIHALDEAGTPLAGWPKEIQGRCYSYPALGDLDGDGDMEVLLISEDYAWAWQGDGTDVAGWPAECEAGFLHFMGPVLGLALGDTDGDGEVEVVARDSKHLWQWDASGNPVNGFPLNERFQAYSPRIGGVTRFGLSLADLDGDGRLEAVSDRVFDLVSGEPLVEVTGDHLSAPAIGDVDGDGRPDIVYFNWNSLAVLNMNGSQVVPWPEQISPVQQRAIPPRTPLLADLNGDGELELTAIQCQLPFWWGNSTVSRIHLWSVGGGTQRVQWPMFGHDPLHTAWYGTALTAPPPVTVVHVTDVAPDRGGQLDIRWEPVAEDAFYQIYRADAPDTPFQKVARVGGTSYRDSAVPSGRHYRYVVRTYLGHRLSPIVIEASGQAHDETSPTTPPDPPTALYAEPSGDHTLSVRWVESQSRDVAGYEIFWQAGQGADAQAGSTRSEFGTSQIITGLEHGQTYLIQVRAYDADDNVSRFAPVVRAVPQDDDVEGPAIHIVEPRGVRPGGTVHIRCTIEDPSGIYDDDTGSEGQGVYLLWDTDGELDEDGHEVQMSRRERIFRSIEPIPLPSAGDTIVCQVIAWDDDHDGDDPSDRAATRSALMQLTIPGRLGDLLVYPNPVREGLATVEHSLLEGTELSVNVFDVSGNRVWQKQRLTAPGTRRRETLRLSALAPGIYLLLFEARFSDGHTEHVTRKIAVER